MSPLVRLLTGTGRLARLVQYTGGSVVATVCSQAAFVLLYGPLHAGTTAASVVGWFAGAIPNYWINRAWVWRQRGRPSARREVVPYAAIIVFTLVLATLITRLVDHAMRSADVASATRTVVVAASFFAVYVVMFGVRFVMFERLFSRLSGERRPSETG